MIDLASPFVRDCCVRGPGESIVADRLYDDWKRWAEDNGHHAGAKSTFGRNLRAVVPELKMTQPRVSGGRERRYDRIALRACNAEDPVPPVPDASDPVPDGSGTGSSRATVTVNAPVNGHGTGGTGERALWSQHDGSGTGASRANAGANDSYTAGLCRDCGVNPHSPGRTRCEECHRDRLTSLDGYDR